jgi:iron complex outermembrane recepter protein
LYKTICILCAGLYWALLLKAETNPPKQLTLRIEVTDSVTKKPLEAASITLAETQWHSITNSLGMAKADSLSKGWYTVQCSFIGYHSFSQKIWMDNDRVLKIELCPESEHLHEVEIVSHTDELRDFGVQTKVILHAQQIERARGTTFADQLKQLSGVTLLSTGPAIAKPVIRGLHSNRLVTINNGVRQEGQQWGSDHGAEIDPFAPAIIEVIKGAASVEYGAEAMGGVVKVNPKPYRENKGMNGEVQLMGASNNGMGAGSLQFEGSHFEKHKLSWRAQGSFRKAGDSHSPEYVMSNTGFQEISGVYGLHYSCKRFHAEVSQSLFTTNMGILRSAHVGNQGDLINAIQREKPPFIAPFTYSIESPRQQISHRISTVKLWYGFNNQTKIHIQLSSQMNDRAEYDRLARQSQRELFNAIPAYQLLLKTDLVETKLEHQLYKNIRGVIGINWMNQGNVSEGLQPILPNYRAYTYGIFLIEKWQQGRWMAEAGVRYDWRDQTRFIYENGIQSNSMLYDGATFSVGGGYVINEFFKINSNVSSAWRPPSINELYSYGLHGGSATFEIGNPNLVAERNLNSEVGLVLNYSKWNGELNLFRNQFRNFIYRLPNPVPTLTIRGSFPMMNFVQDDALLQGSELNVTRLLGKSFSAGINASFLHAQNTTDNVPLIFMPANRARFTLAYQKAKVWKLNGVFADVQYNYVATQNRFPQGIDIIDPPAAYGLLDINAGCETRIGKQPIRISMSVYNALNASYRDYLSRLRYYTLEPGINFLVRLTIPFTIYQHK